MRFLSTTALANQADLEPADVFQRLEEKKYIVRVDERFELGELGISLGGEYKRFGQDPLAKYIVWPEEVFLEWLRAENFPRGPEDRKHWSLAEEVIAKQFVINQKGKYRPVYMKARVVKIYKNRLLLAFAHPDLPAEKQVLLPNVYKVDDERLRHVQVEAIPEGHFFWSRIWREWLAMQVPEKVIAEGA